MPDLDLAAERSRLVGRQASRDDFRIGEADRRDAALVPAPLVASDDLGNHFALRHGAVRQHRLAGDVTDRVDAAHRGAALIIDANEAAIHLDVDFLAAPSLGDRLAPYRDKDIVGDDFGSSPSAVSISSASPLEDRPFAFAPVNSSTPSSASRLATGRGEFGVV